MITLKKSISVGTRRFPLEEAPRDYEMFKKKEEGCAHSVFIF